VLATISFRVLVQTSGATGTIAPAVGARSCASGAGPRGRTTSEAMTSSRGGRPTWRSGSGGPQTSAWQVLCLWPACHVVACKALIGIPACPHAEHELTKCLPRPSCLGNPLPWFWPLLKLNQDLPRSWPPRNCKPSPVRSAIEPTLRLTDAVAHGRAGGLPPRLPGHAES